MTVRLALTALMGPVMIQITHIDAVADHHRVRTSSLEVAGTKLLSPQSPIATMWHHDGSLRNHRILLIAYGDPFDTCGDPVSIDPAPLHKPTAEMLPGMIGCNFHG